MSLNPSAEGSRRPTAKERMALRPQGQEKISSGGPTEAGNNLIRREPGGRPEPTTNRALTDREEEPPKVTPSATGRVDTSVAEPAPGVRRKGRGKPPRERTPAAMSPDPGERGQGREGIPEIARYMNGLEITLQSLNPTRAGNYLQAISSLPAYQIARNLESHPTQLTAAHGLSIADQLSVGEQGKRGYYTSNEYYAGLEPYLRNLGGVGLVIGSDQPLDFFTMANLKQVYAIDMDPYVSLITRAYLETGSRFHQVLDRYPTTDEYLSLFDGDNRDVLLGQLAAPTAGYSFSREEIAWLRNRYEKTNFGDYLSQKKRLSGNASWIGSTQNLTNVIQAYEQGRFIICTGNMDGDGDLLPTIGEKVSHDIEHVSLIYVSNAAIGCDSDLAAFKALPVTDSTVVVSSCEGGAGRLNHYLFPLTAHQIWPDTLSITRASITFLPGTSANK